MKCQETRDMLLLFLDGRLPETKAKQVRDHLATCRECQQECFAYEKTWEALGIWTREEPEPGFVSRFWQRVSLERPWYLKAYEYCRPVFSNQRFASIFVTACALIFVGTLTFRTVFITFQVESVLTELNSDEIELIEHLDLVENLDVIEQMEFYEDLEYIMDLKV